jgi:hypothetical protein
LDLFVSIAGNFFVLSVSLIVKSASVDAFLSKKKWVVHESKEFFLIISFVAAQVWS